MLSCCKLRRGLYLGGKNVAAALWAIGGHQCCCCFLFFYIGITAWCTESVWQNRKLMTVWFAIKPAEMETTPQTTDMSHFFLFQIISDSAWLVGLHWKIFYIIFQNESGLDGVCVLGHPFRSARNPLLLFSAALGWLTAVWANHPPQSVSFTFAPLN